MPTTVAIVGRPNVGKSTLFNRLVGRKLAIVGSRPGVTRDRREAVVNYGYTSFKLVDTAGLKESKPTTLEGRMRDQTQAAIYDANLVLVVIDGRDGLTPMDRHYNDLVRSSGKNALLVVNKAEGFAAESARLEAYSLGLDEPIALSAEHGDGITDLLDRIASIVDDDEVDPMASRGSADAINLAIVGRPNTGKSTLFNTLIGDKRALTGPEPGVTHDSIHVDWHYKNQSLRLVDTAGLRRRAHITDPIEKLSFEDSLLAIRFSNVAILMLDATEPATRRDLTIAQHIASEGRALVICVNKWDQVTRKTATHQALTAQIQRSLPQLRGVPLVACSAITGSGIEPLMTAVFTVYEQWGRHLPTVALNRWLEAVVAHHPPPLANGRVVKLRYITQFATRPPRFALFANRPKAIPDSYLRYLVNELRTGFNLTGVPIRLLPRAGKNPYTKN